MLRLAVQPLDVGHKLALDPGERPAALPEQSSSRYPMYAPHTNVKGLQCDVEKPVVARNTVVAGKSSITFHTTDYSGYDVLDPSAL